MNNKFKIITPVYNAEKYIKKCIDSLKAQLYKNYEVVIIDACSTDKTGDIIKKEIKGEDKFHLITNKVRKHALENTIDGIHHICENDEDIIVIVDGDDWLRNPYVLQYLNKIYQDENVWTTYGQFISLSTKLKSACCIEIKGKFNRFRMRDFYFSHLRTYKYFLFKAIKEEDLRDKDGKYYTTAGDAIIALPIIELAGEKHRKCISKILYVYNDLNKLNDMKVCPTKQVKIFVDMIHKPAYPEYIKVKKAIQIDNKIDILIWAKNRACQLDLLLRSIKDNFLGYNKIYVRYDYTSPEFKKGFQKVIKKNYGLPITYIETSGDFEKDTKDIINNKFKTQYMLNLCDDDVFIRPTRLDNIIEDYTDEVCAISLRMSEDIIWCYGNQKSCELPEFYPIKRNGLKWKWADSDPSTDWGYPSAVNIHLYGTKWFREIIKDLHFDTPNKLEYLFNTNRKIFKPYIISLKKTRILNIPINQVQTLSPTNPYGKKYTYTLKELNDRFLKGEIINTANIYNHNNHAVNEELEFHFIKEK